MKFKLAVLLLSVCAALGADPIRELGVIRKSNWIAWDHPDTNIIAYKVFVGETNFQPAMTNIMMELMSFTNIAMVTDKKWSGASYTNLNGWKALYVTAIAGLTNGTTEESDRSEVVKVFFRYGVPIPPSNIKLFDVLQYMGTNQLEVLSAPTEATAPPFPDTQQFALPLSRVQRLDSVKRRLKTLSEEQKQLIEQVVP